jgi:peroxiredoxin Q/BCP
MVDQDKSVGASGIQAGDLAPQFCLKDASGVEVCLSSFKGKWLVLYFYPKDNTSGCTLEAKQFTESLQMIHDFGAEVVGISKDSVDSHRRFHEKHGLKIVLLSDQEHSVIEAYGAWGIKKLYGKESFGTKRSTFLIDPAGRIIKVWRNVKVKGHVEAVVAGLLDALGSAD